MTPRLPLIVLAGLALGACTPEPAETLVGCFSMSQGASQEFRVQRTAEDGYALSWRRLDRWSAPVPLTLADRAWIESQFGDEAGKIQASVRADGEGFALHRVQAGQTLAGGMTDSGFVGQFYFGAGQVYKAAECI